MRVTGLMKRFAVFTFCAALLGACTPPETYIACPNILIPLGTDRVTRFAPGEGRDITDIIVHAQHVGVGVVAVVVAIAPVIGGTPGVPLVGLAHQALVLHEVILTVHHIVAQLHVFQNFRHAQSQGTKNECRRENTGHQHAATRDLGVAHRFFNFSDVLGIAFAHVSQMLLANRFNLGVS